MWRYPNSVGEPARLTRRHLITCLGLWNHLEDKFHEPVVDNRADLDHRSVGDSSAPPHLSQREGSHTTNLSLNPKKSRCIEASAGIAASCGRPCSVNSARASFNHSRRIRPLRRGFRRPWRCGGWTSGSLGLSLQALQVAARMLSRPRTQRPIIEDSTPVKGRSRNGANHRSVWGLVELISLGSTVRATNGKDPRRIELHNLHTETDLATRVSRPWPAQWCRRQ